MAAKNKPNELYITRIFDAPVKMVWEAWVDPEQAALWWGPRGFTITNYKKEVKVGGIWHYDMHGPDGVDYPNKTVYLEVKKYSRLVYDHGGYDDRPPMFRVTVDFIDLGDKTKMEMVMALPTPEAAKEAKKFIKKAQGNSTWDRLAEYLSPKDKFIINRSFDAPIEKVFEMWTNSKHVSKWLPPIGFNMEFLEADLKAGGTTFYSMTSAEGMKIYGKSNYKEITEPNRIVYTQAFCDENGNMSTHPLAPTWPKMLLTTVTFAEEGPQATRVTVTMEVYGDATAIELETFNKAKDGMTEGWNGSFDKLEDNLGI